MKITIDMDAVDFDYLWTTSMRWAGEGWHDQPDRFTSFSDDEINYSLRTAYWFDNYASVILGREFLRHTNVKHQVLFDEAGEADGYVITADRSFPHDDDPRL